MLGKDRGFMLCSLKASRVLYHLRELGPHVIKPKGLYVVGNTKLAILEVKH